MFGDFNQGSHPPARTQAGGGAGTIGNFSVLEGKSEEEQRLLQIQLLTQAANDFHSLANAKKILPWEEADQVIEQVSDNAHKGMEALQAANGAMLELQPHLARAIIVNGQQLLKQDGSVKADHGMRSMMHALLDHQALNMGQPALPAKHNNHMIGFEFNKIPGDLLLRRESRKISIDIMKNVTSKRNPSAFVEVTTGPLFREMLERLFELAGVIHGEEPMHKAEKKWRGCLKLWREAKWQVEWCILVWLQHCEEFSSHLRQWAMGLGGLSRPKPDFLTFLPRTTEAIAEFTTRAHLQDAEDPRWNGVQQPLCSKRAKLNEAPDPAPEPTAFAPVDHSLPSPAGSAAGDAGATSNFVTTSILPRLTRAVPQHPQQRRDKII
jgi:hypothetical protein